MDLPSAAIGLLLSLRSLPCGNTSIDWSNQHKPYKYKFFFSIPAHFRPLFCLSLFLCIPLRVIRAFFLTFSHALFPGISFFVILTFFRSSSHALLPGISFCVIRTLFRSSSYVLLPGFLSASSIYYTDFHPMFSFLGIIRNFFLCTIFCTFLFSFHLSRKCCESVAGGMYDVSICHGNAGKV